MTENADKSELADGDVFVERVLAYLEDTLAENEVEALEAEMSGDAGKRQLFVDVCLQISLLREAPSNDVAPTNRPAQGNKQLEPAAEAHNLRDWALQMSQLEEDRPRKRDHRWFGLALAMTLLIAFGLWWRATAPIGKVNASSGDAVVVRSGIEILASVGQALHRGDVLQSKNGSVQVVYTDGTTVRLAQNTTTKLGITDAHGKLLVLKSGHLVAEVQPQPASRPLCVAAAESLVTVLGTTLDVLIDDDQAVLHVAEGRVRMSSDGAEQEVVVEQGQVARANHAGTLTLDDGQWPVDRQGVQFLFTSQHHPNVVFLDDHTYFGCQLKLVDEADYDASGAMRIRNGSLRADEQAAKRVLNSCRDNGELTIEALVWPERLSHDEDARIVSQSLSSGEMNFMLGQTQEEFVARLAVVRRGGRKESTQWSLGKTELNRWQHIALTYRQGKLTFYRDGQQEFSQQLSGNLDGWKLYPLNFGNDAEVSRAWRGRLRCVAIYDRCLQIDEIRSNSKRVVARD